LQHAGCEAIAGTPAALWLLQHGFVAQRPKFAAMGRSPAMTAIATTLKARLMLWANPLTAFFIPLR
jgi:hypothetical protein